MDGVKDADGQPQSLGEYIQANQQQVIAYDSASGQGFALSPSARVNEDAPITEGSQGVEPTPDAAGGQGTADAGQGVAAPVAAQPSPEMDELRARLAQVEADRDQTNQLLVQQAQAAARREYDVFVKSLEGLEPEVKEARLLQYQNQQLVNHNRALQQRMQANEQGAEETKQRIAKTQVAHILAHRNGLPPEYAKLLLRANSATDMEHDAAFLANEFRAKQGSQQAQQRQQAMQGDQFRPTGDNAGAPVPPGPKKRSGDLQGLIGSRQYTVQAVNR